MLVKKAESLHSRDVRVPASMQTRSVDSILRLMMIKKVEANSKLTEYRRFELRTAAPFHTKLSHSFGRLAITSTCYFKINVNYKK